MIVTNKLLLVLIGLHDDNHPRLPTFKVSNDDADNIQR